MVLARYTPETQKLVYANAGHIYPFIWSHQAVIEQKAAPDQAVSIEPNFIKVRGIPLGILPIWKGKPGETTLKPGDIFLLSSDGITEATIAEPLSSASNDAASSEFSIGSMLKQEGLWQLVLQEPAPFDLNNLLARVREHTNNIQEDDQTILSLEVL